MSIWYDLKIYVYGNRKDIAKFFNLDSEEDVLIDNFEFLFGQKNCPGLRLDKIIQRNPGLVFLVRKNVDCGTTIWTLQRHDCQLVIQNINTEFGSSAVSMKLQRDYFDVCKFNKTPTSFDWFYYFNYDRAKHILDNVKEYEALGYPIDEEDSDIFCS